MMMITDYFPFLLQPNLLTLLLRTLLVIGCAGIIGLDRNAHGAPAGFRTHILVCLGTTLATMAGVFALYQFPGTNIDVTRLGGQMLAGIGFLGAGVIFISNKNRIEGLTTAAGLWACTSCGLAIGFGFFIGTLIAVILILITMFALPVYEQYVHRRENHFDLYIEFEQGTTLTGFLRLLHIKDVAYSNYRVLKEDDGTDGPIAIISISMRRDSDKAAFLTDVKELDGLKYLHEHQPRDNK